MFLKKDPDAGMRLPDGFDEQAQLAAASPAFGDPLLWRSRLRGGFRVQGPQVEAYRRRCPDHASSLPLLNPKPLNPKPS